MHRPYMKRVLELARGGWGKTNPNPLVGAVIVKDGKIIAEGYHESVGNAHAEVNAIKDADKDIEGSTLYVNLEPCSHYGRTPPCVDSIIKAGVKEVIVAMEDPNPLVLGRGIEILRCSGLEVVVGILEKEARKLNEIFIKYITQKKPFVIMKSAMTLDGKICSTCGDSKWISGEASRSLVHDLRNRVSAIMVGINTVLADDPCLTTRLDSGKGKDPIRIVIDSNGLIPLNSRVINTDSPAEVILATTNKLKTEKEKRLLEKGVRILKIDGQDGHVSLDILMDELYKLEIDSVILEGGGGLNAAALYSGIVDKVMFFISPRIVGGADAKTPVEGKGIEFIKDAYRIKDICVDRSGEDILIEGYVR